MKIKNSLEQSNAALVAFFSHNSNFYLGKKFPVYNNNNVLLKAPNLYLIHANFKDTQIAFII